jgi:glutamyl-tRNA synthetase
MYRFAPSLTKDLHIENLRTAMFNYICAIQDKEKFIVRIEDIDKKKNIEGKDQEILELLNLFGISFDQVIYQSEGLKFHRQLGSKLLMDGNAFSCFCTPEILEQKKQEAKNNKQSYRYDETCKKLSDAEIMENESPFVIRAKKPSDAIEFTDLIKSDIKFEPKDIDDFVILKVDKTPTYNFACALDDMLYSIKTVIRSEDYISDTPKQKLIHQYLGYDQDIQYAHLPTILNQSGKQDDDTSVKWLLEEGFLPDAIVNYLILIANETPKEIFTLKEAIEWFDIKNISKTPVKFDMKKLRQINKEHIKLLNPLELAKFIGYSSKDLGELAKVYLEEASTINEIKDKIDSIFSIKSSEEFADKLKLLKEASKDLPYYKNFDEFKNILSEKSGLKGEELLKPLHILLTNKESGPNLNDIYPHIKNYLGEIIKCS